MARNIWVAVADGELDVIKKFIESKEATANSQDDNGYSPMHAAASYKNTEILQYLIDNQGNPNLLDNDGDSPLHMCEDLECAKLLLQAGADIQALNNEGKNPIESITENGEIELAKAICEYANIPFELPESLLDEDEDVDLGELEGLASEENLNLIMNYIVSNAEAVDLNDEEAIKKLVSEYILNNMNSGNASSANQDQADL